MNSVKILLLLVMLSLGTLSTGTYAQKVDGAWVLVGEGVWESVVTVQGRTLRVRTFFLSESGRAGLFVHEPCANGRTERLAWSAGDGYGALIDCDNNAHRSSLPVLIERELREGLPKELKQKLQEFHNKKKGIKGTFVFKNAPISVRFFFYKEKTEHTRSAF